MPESSDGESIHSIVIPPKKLFVQKKSQHQKIFGQIIGTRETMTKSNKDITIDDKVVYAETKQLFQNKPRTKPLFPAALLDVSPDKTVMDKTKASAAEPKTQARNLFGNRQGAKRKNMFADFIVSDSEDEISDIQPKVFGFTKKPVPIRRASSASRGFRESSPTTDTDMDEWRLLPSSTMVEHQLEAMMEPNTPKRPRLSKLTEIKESSGANTVFSKTKSPEVTSPVLTRSRLRELNNSTSSAGEKNKTPVKSDQNHSKKNNRSHNNKSKDKIKEGNKISEQNEDENLRIADISQENETNKNKSQTHLKVTNLDKSQELVKSEQNEDQNQEVVDGNQTVNVALVAYQSQQQIDKEQEEHEVKINLENSKQKVIAKSQQAKEREEINKSKKNDSKKEVEEEDENQELKIEIQEVAEDTQEEESQGRISESQVQDDENEEQGNESQEHCDESVEQKDEGQAVDQILVEGDEANNQSEVDENHIENDEEIDQSVDKLNESNEVANESNEISDQNREEKEVDESNEVANETQEEVDESNEVINETQEEVDESDEAINQSQKEVDESDAAINQSQEEIDESNEAVNATEEEVDESNEIQNDSQLAIEDNENEATEHDENVQEEVDDSHEQNESQEDDQNEEVEDEDDDTDNAELHYESASEEMEVDDDPQNDKDETLTPIDQQNNTNTPEPARNKCNISHDTTGRHRNKHTSPEAILHDRTKQSDSFTAHHNTSIKTKSIGFAAGDSVDFSNRTTNSSAEGSGWDSHRTTRKTIRQTFGKNATPRKSLRALVMEKSAKRQTFASETAKVPLANSTELPDMSLGSDIQPKESTHEVSLRTRQMTLDAVLDKIKEDSLKRRAKIVSKPILVLDDYSLISNKINRYKPYYSYV